MVQLIVGVEGKGKTKYLLDKVNEEVKTVAGNIVFLDKNAKHMYDLNNKVRLVNVSDYLVSNQDEFIGFLCGIISQDHDLEQVYCDNFLKIATLHENDFPAALSKLEQVSQKFCVDFVVSVSAEADSLPEEWKAKVIVSL